MTKINGSDAMLKVIYDWGIDHIYGFPGGSFDSSMNAIYDFRDKMKSTYSTACTTLSLTRLQCLPS